MALDPYVSPVCTALAHQHAAIPAVEYWEHDMYGGISLCDRCAIRLGPKLKALDYDRYTIRGSTHSDRNHR